MTFKQAMIKAMTSRGMRQSDAVEIIEMYILSNEGNPMMDRWHEDVNGYPEGLQGILWMGVKEYAAKWLEDNLPEAWYRPMFQYSDSQLQQMMNERNRKHDKTIY